MDDVALEIAREKLAAMKASAKPVEEIVKAQIRAGTNCAYLSLRYGLPLERLTRYRDACEAQRQAQAKRADACDGVSSLRDSGVHRPGHSPVPDGAQGSEAVGAQEVQANICP